MGRDSPASASGSFTTANAPFSGSVSDMLRDLELEAAADDDYSFLDGSHPLSFASVPLPPPLMSTRSRSCMQGASSPVFTTPVRSGGVKGGVAGISPSTGANSRGLESPIVPAAKGMGKPQRCMHIDEAAMVNLCFGLIGSGERFCLAKKLGTYTHCGIPAHAKGIREKNKAKVVADAYYVPGGTIHQRPTAKVEPMIARVDLPAKYISTFRTSRLTTAKWKYLIIDARTDIGDSDKEDDNSKTNEGTEDNKMEEDNDSIPSGSEEGDFLAEEAFKVTWDCSISQVGREADWAPTAQAHRTAIDLLGSVLNSSTRRHLACIKTLNARADLGSQEANDI